MTEEEREINKELEKYELGFYSKKGKYDWERGMANSENNGYGDDDEQYNVNLPENHDESSEYNDIMNEMYDDENN